MFDALCSGRKNRSRWEQPDSQAEPCPMWGSARAEQLNLNGVRTVNQELIIDQLIERAVDGDRNGARAVVGNTIDHGMPAEQLVTDVLWPAYETVQRLHREDALSELGHRLATRLLRVLVDQAYQRYDIQPLNGRSVFAVCGPTDADELGGQIAVDLLEREGFEVAYSGGGIANDEILERLQRTQPDVLLMFASAPGDLPVIRALIDTIREIGACSGIQIVVGGGVFSRAHGLAEEIGADLWADEPIDLVETMVENPERRAPAEQRTVGRKRQAA